MAQEKIRIASVDNADRRIKEIPNLDFAINAIADYDNGLTQGFTDGVNWADKNQKDGLVSIDKVCEWIRENWRNHIHKDADDMIVFIGWERELRKAMEE